jgi:hypothetical protein
MIAQLCEYMKNQSCTIEVGKLYPIKLLPKK